MKKGLFKLLKSRVFMITIGFIITALILTSPVLASGSSEVTSTDTDETDVTPVEVPVVLDGVLYQASEFNSIHTELHAKRVYLTFVINPSDGVFYAFTSRSGYEEFAVKNGLPSVIKMMEATEIGYSGSLIRQSYLMFNFEHINYGGQYLTLAYVPGYYSGRYPDLHDYGWNDRISSMYGSPSNTAEWAFEHINYGGDSLIVLGECSDLHPYGFNDKISSAIIGWQSD